MARVPWTDEGNETDWLIPLAAFVGVDVIDPVELAMSHDMLELKEAVGRLRGDDALAASFFVKATDVIFDPPAPTCTKVCCLALNYQDHAAESELEVPPEPVLFFKPTSTLIGHGGVVSAPSRTRHLEHEVELGVVIGTRTHALPSHRWIEAVAGYTVLNDMTARDLQLVNVERNVPWDQSKAFDTFAPLGPYLVTVDEVPDPHSLSMTLSVDGQVRQAANTSQMVFPIPQLIENLSDGMTLLPGDVIATGTTAGIAPLKDGDVMTATINGIGSLINPVRYQPHSRA